MRSTGIAAFGVVAAIVGGCQASNAPAPSTDASASPQIATPPPSATAMASATAAPAAASSPPVMETPPPVQLDPKATWNGRWPLPQFADANRCTTPKGEPGLTVNGKECHNPCLPGMAPVSPRQCAAKCASDADCTKGGRLGTCDAGACKRPLTLACAGRKAPAACKAEAGREGQRCEGDEACTPLDMICPEGLVMYGGTNCVKRCTKAADCPRGRCDQEEDEASCIPLCPSEGCPYLWE